MPSSYKPVHTSFSYYCLFKQAPSGPLPQPLSSREQWEPALSPSLSFSLLLQVTPLVFWLHTSLTQLLPRSSESFKCENGFHFSYLTVPPHAHTVSVLLLMSLPKVLRCSPSHQPVLILLLLPRASFSASPGYPILPMLWVLHVGVTKDFVFGLLLPTLFSPAWSFSIYLGFSRLNQVFQFSI